MNGLSRLLLALTLADAAGAIAAFVAGPPSSSRSIRSTGRGVGSDLRISKDDGDAGLSSRRGWVRDASVATLGGMGIAAAAVFSPPESANASGGATAGGGYLLSAKQRYNRRVTSGVTVFLSLSGAMAEGKISAATKDFFSLDTEGSWKDLAAAGYLLSNAFRTSSGTPPDRLPSVKKWKAFMAEVEDMKKAVLVKKSGKGAQRSYENAVGLLDEYLEAVELPPSAEIV